MNNISIRGPQDWRVGDMAYFPEGTRELSPNSFMPVTYVGGMFPYFGLGDGSGMEFFGYPKAKILRCLTSDELRNLNLIGAKLKCTISHAYVDDNSEFIVGANKTISFVDDSFAYALVSLPESSIKARNNMVVSEDQISKWEMRMMSVGHGVLGDDEWRSLIDSHEYLRKQNNLTINIVRHKIKEACVMDSQRRIEELKDDIINTARATQQHWRENGETTNDLEQKMSKAIDRYDAALRPNPWQLLASVQRLINNESITGPVESSKAWSMTKQVIDEAFDWYKRQDTRCEYCEY